MQEGRGLGTGHLGPRPVHLHVLPVIITPEEKPSEAAFLFSMAGGDLSRGGDLDYCLQAGAAC